MNRTSDRLSFTEWKQKYLTFWNIVIVVTLFLAMLFIVYPFGNMFFQSFSTKDGGAGFDNYETFFKKRYYYRALFNSLKICVTTTVAALAVGLPMAYIASRLNIWGKRIIDVAVILSLLSPPFIGAYSWILMFGRSGIVTRFLAEFGIDLGNIYGFKGIVLVFTLKLYPYVYMYVSGALGSIDASLEEASANLGITGLKRIFKITFPLIMPTILSSGLIVFMTALADFGTPLLLGEGYKVLPVLIYDEYLSEVGSNTYLANAMSVLIVIISGSILLAQKWVINRKSYNMSALNPPAIKQLTTGKRFLASAFVWTVALVSLIPQAVVAYTSFLKTKGPLFVEGYSLDSYRYIIFKLSRNVHNTFVFALIALAIMIVIGLLLSYIIVRRRSKATGLLDFLIMFPYVLPGSVLGIGLVKAFNQGPLILAGTMWIMIISYTIRKLPFTLRSSIGILYQIDPSVEEASISLGVSPMKTFFKVVARMMMPGLLSGAVLSFIAVINEVSSSIILFTGRTVTMSVTIFSEINRSGYGTAAALATLLSLITVFSLLVFRRLGGRDVV